jgi:hypothetical protein
MHTRHGRNGRKGRKRGDFFLAGRNLLQKDDEIIPLLPNAGSKCVIE